MSQRFQPLERKDELDTVRLLWPKRAVIVEYRDAIGAGTKSGVASVVTRLTKSTRRALAAPSFHEGSGSAGTYFKATNRSLSSIL